MGVVVWHWPGRLVWVGPLVGASERYKSGDHPLYLQGRGAVQGTLGTRRRVSLLRRLMGRPIRDDEEDASTVLGLREMTG